MSRPTKYKPEFCERAVEFLSQGYSHLALAGELGISESTLYEWKKAHPEFSESIKGGDACCARWWEDRNRDLAASGNATAVVFGLKNRAGWKDKTETEHSGEIPVTIIERTIVKASDPNG